jgi:nucleoside phosphorylase
VNVLIVDDQYEGKAKQLSRIAASIQGVKCELVVSAKDALRKMKENEYELVIVDLQIPPENGQEVEPLGGQNLLQYVEVSEDLYKPAKILALTVHQDSYDQCSEFFSRRGWTLLLNPAEDHLRDILTAQLMRAATTPQVDIAILTALEHTELEAVLKLPYGWTEVRYKDDITTYHLGTIKLASGETKSVVACSSHRMGLAAAATLTTKVCICFRPSFLAMTGIAAGVVGEANLGDILVADPSWDWGSGKLTIKDGAVKFLSEPVQIPLDPEISSRMRKLALSRTCLDEIYTAWKDGTRPPHDLQLRIGPIASGAVVLEDPATVELIRTQNRKTIGIEMEAFGVMSASFYAGKNRPRTVVIKSVCDFADPQKNNEWQTYAAYTSAAFLDKFLQHEAFT